ncbi:uncharacterized protein LOC108737002 [Agrilus planipennis]|uniref:Gustatory receptor n=1 Tax=Agrilus planipennis TaxID=224129 RepID=A0A1W4WYB3_AGRPL|nr:uncharacterized protein LOC108737002 [Agrilus planipennis]
MQRDIYKRIESLSAFGRYMGLVSFQIKNSRVFLSKRDWLMPLLIFVIHLVIFVPSAILHLKFQLKSETRFIFSDFLYVGAYELSWLLLTFQGITNRRRMKDILQKIVDTDQAMEIRIGVRSKTSFIVLSIFFVNLLIWTIMDISKTSDKYWLPFLLKISEIANGISVILNFEINAHVKIQLETLNLKLENCTHQCLKKHRNLQLNERNRESLYKIEEIYVNYVKKKLHLHWLIIQNSRGLVALLQIGIIGNLINVTCSATIMFDYLVQMHTSGETIFSIACFIRNIAAIVEIIKDIIITITIIYSWVMVSSEASKMGPLIHDIWNKITEIGPSNKSMEFFKLASIHIIHTKPNFKLFGFSPITWNIFPSFVNLVITYGCILLQLQLDVA